MSMKIEITLTPAQIEAAIKDYLTAQGFDVKDLRYNINSGGEDYRGGWVSPSIKNMVVEVSPRDTNRSFNSLAAQISAVENDSRDR